MNDDSGDVCLKESWNLAPATLEVLILPKRFVYSSETDLGHRLDGQNDVTQHQTSVKDDVVNIELRDLICFL